MRRQFRQFNPYAVFVYYLVIIGATVMSRHPVFSLLSFFFSVIYGYIVDREKLSRLMKMIIPLMIFTVLVNSLFNHYGVTRLFRLPSGNNVTLEVLFQGILLTSSFGAVSVWLLDSTDALDYQKFMHILRHVFSGIVLVMTMSIRFIPLYSRQVRLIIDAQKGIGNLKEEKGYRKRLKNSLDIFSILTSWALENSIETADSMRARRYALKKRSSYRRYSFNDKDALLLTAVAVTAVMLIMAGHRGLLTVKYNPVIKFPVFDTVGYLSYAAFALLAALPVMVEIYGEKKWNF